MTVPRPGWAGHSRTRSGQVVELPLAGTVEPRVQLGGREVQDRSVRVLRVPDLNGVAVAPHLDAGVVVGRLGGLDPLSGAHGVYSSTGVAWGQMLPNASVYGRICSGFSKYCPPA